MRITAVGTTADADGVESFQVLWSRATSEDLPLRDAAEIVASDSTPAVGEQLIMLETVYSYTPPSTFECRRDPRPPGPG